MVLGKKARETFKMIFPDLNSCAIESIGLFEGLLSLWDPRITSFKDFSSSIGIILKGHFRGFTFPITRVNSYGPYSDRENLWDQVQISGLLEDHFVLMERDLNFIIADGESWGTKSQ